MCRPFGDDSVSAGDFLSCCVVVSRLVQHNYSRRAALLQVENVTMCSTKCVVFCALVSSRNERGAWRPHHSGVEADDALPERGVFESCQDYLDLH